MDQTKTIERRSSQLELRADEKTISGYAARFYDGSTDTEYKLYEGVVERVSRNAFDEILADPSHEIIASVDHDMKTILGKRSAGDLKLSIDNVGLKYEIAFDSSDPDHTRIARKIAKRHYTGSSFAWRVAKDSWKQENGLKVRTLENVKLVELGPVLSPAYGGSTTSFRSVQESLADWETQKLIDEINDLTA